MGLVTACLSIWGRLSICMWKPADRGYAPMDPLAQLTYRPSLIVTGSGARGMGLEQVHELRFHA